MGKGHDVTRKTWGQVRYAGIPKADAQLWVTHTEVKEYVHYPWWGHSQPYSSKKLSKWVLENFLPL